MQAGRDIDGQIVPCTWVRERKTEPTIWYLIPCEVSIRKAGREEALSGKTNAVTCCARPVLKLYIVEFQRFLW